MECPICCEPGDFADAQNPLMRCRANCSGMFHAQCVMKHIEREQASEAFRRKKGHRLETCPFCKVEFPVIHALMDDDTIRSILPKRQLYLAEARPQYWRWATAEEEHKRTDEPLEHTSFSELAEKIRAQQREKIMPLIALYMVPDATYRVMTLDMIPGLYHEITDAKKNVFKYLRETRIKSLTRLLKDKLDPVFEEIFGWFVTQHIFSYKRYGFNRDEFLAAPASAHRHQIKSHVYWSKLTAVIGSELNKFSFHMEAQDHFVKDTLQWKYLNDSDEVILKYKSRVLEALGCPEPPPRQLSDVPAEALGGGEAAPQRDEEIFDSDNTFELLLQDVEQSWPWVIPSRGQAVAQEAGPASEVPAPSASFLRAQRELRDYARQGMVRLGLLDENDATDWPESAGGPAPRSRQGGDVEHEEVDGRPARRQRREDGSA